MPLGNKKSKKTVRKKKQKTFKENIAKLKKKLTFFAVHFSKKFVLRKKKTGRKQTIKKVEKKKFQMQKNHWILVGISLLIVAIGFQIFGISKIKGATFGWIQTDWSGGADLNAKANHTSDQSSWSKFFSKDANVDTSGGEVKLARINDSSVITTDSDFNAGAKTKTFVKGAGNAGAIYAQKSDGMICSTNQECVSNICLNSACISPCTTNTTCGTICAFGGLVYGEIVAEDGRCWLDRNLGASRKAVSIDDYLAYGSLYQWGRASDGHQLIAGWDVSIGTPVNGTTSILSNTDTPGNSNFILASGDWRSPKNLSLWQGLGGINNPCPPGFRLPTITEWQTYITAANVTNAASFYSSQLKILRSGKRVSTNGAIQLATFFGYYWSSSLSSGWDKDWAACNVFFYDGGVYPNAKPDGSCDGGSERANGQPVRCIHD